MSMIHRIIPEKVDIAVGGGGATMGGASCAGTGVTVGEGGTALVKRAKQQKCDTSAVTTPLFGLYLVGTSCQVPDGGIKCFYDKLLSPPCLRDRVID